MVFVLIKVHTVYWQYVSCDSETFSSLSVVIFSSETLLYKLELK